MVTFTEAIKRISELADQKNWGEDIGTKIFYGIIEFCEAGNLYKHRDDPEWLKEIGLLNKYEVKIAIATELIDVLLYLLHGFHCIGFNDIDVLFEDKMSILEERDRVYTDDRRN